MSTFTFPLEFQRKLFSFYLRDAEFASKVEQAIRPEYFNVSGNILLDLCREVKRHREEERQIVITLETCLMLAEKAVNLRSANNRARRSRELLELFHAEVRLLYQIDLTHDRPFMLTEVGRFARTQAICSAIEQSLEELSNGDTSQLEGRFMGALRVGVRQHDFGITYGQNTSERFARYHLDEEGRISTGLPVLDAIMRGGLAKGELGVIVAPPKGFKTGALINLTVAPLFWGKKVLFVELEMTERQIAHRIDCRLLDRTSPEIYENPIESINRLEGILGTLPGKLVIQAHRSNTIGVPDLRNELRLLREERGFVPDLIVLDYAELLRPPRNHRDRRDIEIAEVYRSVKNLGEEHGVPIWTAMQANRGALNKRHITISDIAECFMISGIADAIIALCQTVEEREANIMRLFLAVMRSAMDGVDIHCRVDKGKMRLANSFRINPHLEVMPSGFVAVRSGMQPSTQQRPGARP